MTGPRNPEKKTTGRPRIALRFHPGYGKLPTARCRINLKRDIKLNGASFIAAHWCGDTSASSRLAEISTHAATDLMARQGPLVSPDSQLRPHLLGELSEQAAVSHHFFPASNSIPRRFC